MANMIKTDNQMLNSSSIFLSSWDLRLSQPDQWLSLRGSVDRRSECQYKLGCTGRPCDALASYPWSHSKL